MGINRGWGVGGFNSKSRRGRVLVFDWKAVVGLVIASILGYFGQSKDQGIWIESRGHIYDA